MLDDTLNIKRLKKFQIEQILGDKGYQTKQDIDSIVKSTSSSDSPYDYLLNMNFVSLSEERCDDLEKKTNEKTKELNILLKKTPEDLWKEDLEEFTEAYKIAERADIVEMTHAYKQVCKKAKIKCSFKALRPQFTGKRRRSFSRESISDSYSLSRLQLEPSSKPITSKRQKKSENSELSINSSLVSSDSESSFNIEENDSNNKMQKPKGRQMNSPKSSLVEENKSQMSGKSNKENKGIAKSAKKDVDNANPFKETITRKESPKKSDFGSTGQKYSQEEEMSKTKEPGTVEVAIADSSVLTSNPKTVSKEVPLVKKSSSGAQRKRRVIVDSDDE